MDSRTTAAQSAGRRRFLGGGLALLLTAGAPGRFPAAQATGDDRTLEFTLPEHATDLRTGITVRRGDRLLFDCGGEITPGWLQVIVGPEGWPGSPAEDGYPLPGAPRYAVLGKLNGRYFLVGAGAAYAHRGRTSRLSPRINDAHPGDGSGAFLCRVNRLARGRG